MNDPPRSPLPLRALRWALLAAAALGILLLLAWTTLAIHYSNLPWPSLRNGLAGTWLGGFILAFLLLRRRGRTALVFLAASCAIGAWWALIPASNDRDWVPENAVQPEVTFQGDRVTVRHIRDFEYRSEKDFTPRYYDRTFDLADAVSLDLVKSRWAGPAIAHTMLSFGFRDGWHLVLSVETRTEKGEAQGALPGLFKQFELIYILADERDLIRLRTNFRGEEVYLFPFRGTPEKVRLVLRDVLEKAERLRAQPEFYNTLTHNCTLGLMPHFDRIRDKRPPFDIRLLLNGFIDTLIYERDGLDTVLSEEETQALSRIDLRVKGDPDPAGFSEKIRIHFPKLRGQ